MRSGSRELPSTCHSSHSATLEQFQGQLTRPGRASDAVFILARCWPRSPRVSSTNSSCRRTTTSIKYNNGNSWMRVSQSTLEVWLRRRRLAELVGEFGHRGARVSLFQTIAQASYRWPQFLLWALLLALVVRAIARTPGRSRRTSDVEDLSTARAEPETWTVQPRLAVVAASSILIVGSFLAVALAGFPVFRYQVTLVPATLVLLAFATQFHPNDRRVAGEPGPRRVAPLTHRGQHAAPAH